MHREHYPTRRAARTAITDYIEIFYNRQRLHSTLRYRTPEQVENLYQTTKTTIADAA